MNFNYSIIIPHKDTPDLLQRCINSIPVRTDVQVIIVDDNSNPEIVDFDTFPGLKRKNTEVIFTKEGKGAGYARNVGVERALGKWVNFMDSDDFFNIKEVAVAMDKYIDSNSDMICFSMTSVDSNDLSKPTHRNNYVLRKFAEARESNSLDVIRYNHGLIHSRFIKQDLIKENNIKCQETRYRNDTLFAVKIGYHATDIILDDLPIYCYTHRGNSTIEIASLEAVKIRYFVSKTVMKYLRSKKVGYKLFEKDLLNSWEMLRMVNPRLMIKEFIEVLILSVHKKYVIKKWMNK